MDAKTGIDLKLDKPTPGGISRQKKEENAMPKKNIYIKDDDLPLFERAEQLGGDSLSQVIADTLRRFVDIKRAEAAGMREVTLETGINPDDTRKVRFLGRLLAEGKSYHGSTTDRKDRWTETAIYQTRGGKFVIHWAGRTLWERENDTADHAVLSHLPGYDEPVEGEWGVITLPAVMLQQAAEALGQELVEWVE